MMSSGKPARSLQAGLALQRAGDLSGADAFYEKLIAREPGNAAAWFLRGSIAQQRGDIRSALTRMERAVQLAPQNPGFLCDLGEVYRRAGRVDEAIRVLERSVAIKPDHAEAQANLGLALRARGRLGQAITCFEVALSLKPALPDCGVLLLRALRESGDYARLLHTCETLLRRVPESLELCRELGEAYAELQRLDEAVVLHEKAVSLAPESADAHASLASALANRAELDRSLAHYRQALVLDPKHVAAHSSLVFTLPYHPDSDAEAIRAEAERFQRAQVADVKPFVGHTNDRTPDRRLRVGYVSGDFRLHAAAMFLVPLLRSHDRKEVEVFCYSNVARPDALTQEMRALADRWCDIAPLGDDAAAQRIREDGVDVLVDLGMHTERSRLFVFARKPAPIQACWLAYAGTTGLQAMDYRITDVHFDPPGLHDEHYAEASARLPETFWCYDPLTALPQVNELPALRSGHITFGCLNTYRKISDPALAVWARVLMKVRSSRLLMVAPRGEAQARVRLVLESHGVSPDRVSFVEAGMPRDIYLQLYHRLDCCLDAFPFQGGTTSLDALWMGVPVVSLVGNTAVGRASVSITRNLGLPELSCGTTDEVVERAWVLTREPVALAQLRASLRARLERSPLMDAPRFARHLEGAYRTMWRRWCATPTHLMIDNGVMS